MKKVLILFALFAALTGSAQVGTATLKTRSTGVHVATNTKTLDTTTAAVDTSYFIVDATNMRSGSLQIVSKRISGTCVVTGYLELSNDNVNWWSKSVADTINLKPAANATKVGGFVITQNTAKYYRIRLISHSTASTQLSGYYAVRKD